MRVRLASCLCSARSRLVPVLLAVILVLLVPLPAMARVFGFHVRELPSSYAAQERFLSQLKDSGANTVIIDLPLNSAGQPDTVALPNSVYLVHQAKMRIFVVMPTRRLKAMLERHPDRMDLRYDVEDRSVHESGNADLFHPEIMTYLAHVAKTIASYSVDGILLGDDFQYASGDGVSRIALAEAGNKLGEELKPKKLFETVTREPDGGITVRPGGLFARWTETKRDRLVEVLEAIRKAARSAKPAIVVGVSVPIDLPMSIPADMLVRHGFDVNAYRKADVDYYWTKIQYRSSATGQQLSPGEGAVVLARSVNAAIGALRDHEKLIIVLPATTESGRALSLSEIEDSTDVVRRRADTGIVYSITPTTIPSATLTRKLFRKEQ